jgi:hypothetical protein
VGGGPVGGDPATIHNGGTALRAAAAGDMSTRAAGFRSVGAQGSGSAGSGALAAAVGRFAAAYGEVCADLNVHLGAAAQ